MYYGDGDDGVEGFENIMDAAAALNDPRMAGGDNTVYQAEVHARLAKPLKDSPTEAARRQWQAQFDENVATQQHRKRVQDLS